VQVVQVVRGLLAALTNIGGQPQQSSRLQVDRFNRALTLRPGSVEISHGEVLLPYR